MSYILDALRRADSERENAAVPGIGSAPGSSHGLDADAPSAIPWRWIGLGLGLGLMVPVIWTFWGSDDPRPDAPAAPEPVVVQPAPPPLALQAPPAPMPPAAVPPAAVAPMPAPPAPVVTPVIRTPSPYPHEVDAPTDRERPPLKTAGALNAAVPAKAPTPRPRADAVPPPAEPGGQGTPATAQMPAPTPAPQGAPSPAGDSRIYALYELPDDVRRSLPSVQVGGSVYSDLPANRILIINGQLYHERDEPAPGLKLETIKLKGAVLNFRGYRYEIEY